MSNATVDQDQIVDEGRKLRELTHQAILVANADTFETLERRFSQLDKRLRTALQTWSLDDVERIAIKLEGGDGLSDAELGLLREVIAGDAAHFVTLENQISEWTNELARLADGISGELGGMEPESIPRLRSQVQKALRLLPHLRQYATERERLEKFDNAVNDLSPTARRVLAESLRVRLEHPDL